jgi:GT2 family glycosyltransferase
MVQSGWLSNLVDTIESDSAIGAAGSMLIYPDGRLQEAGGIIWIDGSGWNYGRGESTEDRRFKFAREVDYCSGASLLVRKEIFECLGGFDERYAPAYYEDADLCFGVRSLGFKVVYQPMSRVVHYEGITAGTDIESGYKQYQEINRSKFAENGARCCAQNTWKTMRIKWKSRRTEKQGRA